MFRRLLVLNFRIVHALSRWSRRRFTTAGRLVLGAMLAAGVLGFDTRQNLSYQAFSVLLAVVTIALVSTALLRMRVGARRALPPTITAGQPFSYPVRVTNRSGRTEQDLRLFDEPVQHLPSIDEFDSLRDPGENRLNWFDRMVGYPRWASLAQRRAGARLEEVAVPLLPVGAETTVTVTGYALRRGYIRFGDILVARPDVLGLCKAVQRIPTRDTLLALPRRYRVPPIRLPGHRRYQRGGIASASEVGDSEEFVSLRDYRPGDPRRHIHWRSWARTGKPVVKEFQDEFFVRHALILDTYATPEQADRFEEAVSVAASVVSAPVANDALLDLMFVGSKPYRFTAGRGLGSVGQFLQVLACVEAATAQPFRTLEQAVSAHASELSGCICVLLAWDGQRRRLVEGLQRRGLPLLVLVVTTAAEGTPLEPGPLADTPNRLHALQVGQVQKGLDCL
ncbi:MAG: DUF58 domain-containing protein [Gammaproteobacteria bacterium]|nr:DUF58 domain-containing protein [Gammaproteobacteria bacterium]